MGNKQFRQKVHFACRKVFLSSNYNQQANSIEVGNSKQSFQFTLLKINYDIFSLMGSIQKQVKVSQNDIKFCGNKDKRAVTTQRVSIRNALIENLLQLRNKSQFYDICDIEQSNQNLKLGQHYGNKFFIVLREVSGVQAILENC